MYSRTFYVQVSDNMPFTYSKFVCDTHADLAMLPTNTQKSADNRYGVCAIGSTAFVVDEGEKYILTPSNGWQAIDLSARNIETDEGAGGSLDCIIATNIHVSLGFDWQWNEIYEDGQYVIYNSLTNRDVIEESLSDAKIIIESDGYNGELQFISEDDWYAEFGASDCPFVVCIERNYDTFDKAYLLQRPANNQYETNINSIRLVRE